MAAGITKDIIGMVSIVDRYELTANDDILNIAVATITLTVPGDIFTNEGDDVAKVTESTITGASGTSIFLGSGNDRLELSNSTLSVAILTGSGNDNVLITGTAQSVVTLNVPASGATALSFGDGDDTLKVASILSGAGSMDFGNGNDTLYFNGGKLLLSGVISNLKNLSVSTLGGTLGRDISLVGSATAITLNGNLTGTNSSYRIFIAEGVTTFTAANNVTTNIGFTISNATFNHVAGGTLKVNGKNHYAFNATNATVILHDLVLTNNYDGGITGSNTAWSITNGNFSNSMYGASLTGGSLNLQNVGFSNNTANALNLKGTLFTGKEISFSGNSNRIATEYYPYSDDARDAKSTVSTSGGSVFFNSSNNTLNSATFSDNNASASASSHSHSSTYTSSSSSFASGGAIYVDGNLTIADTAFSNSSVSASASANSYDYISDHFPDVPPYVSYSLSSSSSSSSSSASGGAIYVDGNLTIADTAFSNSSVSASASSDSNYSSSHSSSIASGGAIYSAVGNLTIAGTTFTGNYASASASAYKNNVPTDTSSSASGGAIYSAVGNLTIAGTTFTGNYASASASDPSSMNNTITSFASSFASGGAIYVNGNLTITGTTFTGNYASASASSFSSVSVSSRADATALGGAIYATNSNLTITDTAFTGNCASASASDPSRGSGYGGAIYLVDDSTLTYTANENKNIFINGNSATYGGFLYMSSSSDKAMFSILDNANLTIGDALGRDSIAGVTGTTITKSGNGYMLINSDISGYDGTVVISGGTLELARIARSISFSDYTIAVGAMLKLSTLNDTVNMNADKNIGGILDLGGGSDVINTNSYALTGGGLQISTLNLTGGGRVSSNIVTRIANAGFNLTLAGVHLESSITGGNAIDVINITQASTVNGVINLGGGNDTITATAAVTFGNTINLGDGNNTLTASDTAQFQKGLTGGNGDDRITLNGQTSFSGVLDLGGGANLVTVNNAVTALTSVKITNGGSTSIIVNVGATLTGNSIKAYSNPLATLTATTLDWSSISGIDKVRILISSDNDFSNYEFDLELYNQNKKITIYTEDSNFIQFQAQGEDGWKQRLLTDTVAPKKVIGLCTTGDSGQIIASWDIAHDNIAGNGVKQYNIQLSDTGTFSNIIGSYTAMGTSIAFSGISDTSYWRVQAEDFTGNKGDWSDGCRLILDTTAPSVPVTLTRTVTGNNAALDWADATDAVSGVKQYEFQVDNNADFSSNEKSGTTVFSNTNATGLADGIYYWRVRTQDNVGNYSDWSNGISFTVDMTAPSVPTAWTKTVIGNSVTLDWADSTDATSGVKQYQVQVDNNNDFSTPEYMVSSVTSTANLTSTDGTYFWRIRAQDNSGNYSAWNIGSYFTVDTSLPSVPADLTRTVSKMYDSGYSYYSDVDFNWADATDAKSGVAQYEIQVDNNSDFSSPEYSQVRYYSDATKTYLADGNYYWRVRTQNNAGNYSEWTTGSSFTVDITAPVPTGLTRTVIGSDVALDWADSTDATSGVKQYDVQIDDNSNFSSPEYAATPAASNANITSLADGNYYWRVRTQDNVENYSAWIAGSSFMVDVTAPAPASLTRTVTGNSVALDWADATDAASGVKQYEYQVDNNSDFSSKEKSGAVVTSTASVNSLADGTYYWRVRTQDNSGNYSVWTTGSSFIVDVTTPSVPSSLSRTVTGSSVALDWADATDPTRGVKKYEIQVDNNSNFSSPEYSSAPVTSNATAVGFADGTYFWKVRIQYNSGNYSAWTSGSSFMVDITLPSIPASLTQVVTGSSVALDWADATDATSGVRQYEYMIHDDGGNLVRYEKSGVVTASNANIAGLTEGTYYWSVRTQDNAGNYSEWIMSSSFFSVDITPPSVPASLTRTVVGNRVALDWADSSDSGFGVKQYEFQIDNNSSFSSNEKLGAAAVSTATVSELAEGTYYWRVRAQDYGDYFTHDSVGNYSAWTSGSNFMVDITAPSVPVTLTRTVTGNNAALDWADATDAVSEVKQYEFQIDNNSDFSSNEKSGTSVASNANVAALADGNYYWRVRSQDNSGNYSTWTTGNSFMIDITAPTVPTTLTRTVTGNNVALDWANATDATSGVKQYEYQIDNNSDFSSNEKSGSSVASNATSTNLADGTYYWKVRTQDNSGNYSAWTTGSSFTVDTTAPTVPTTLTRTITGSSVALDWANATDSLSGVKQYEYQVDNNADFSSNEKSGIVTASNASVTALADGNYFWRVRTQDNSGNYSAWSSGSNFTVDITAPSIPATLTRTVTGSNIALDWADATDATSGVKNYIFQYATNALFTGATQSAVAASNANVSKLADGTYYWRVQTTDNSGNASAWTSGGSFVIDITAPSVPANLTPIVTGNSVTLDWADATDATSGVKQYEYQVDNNSNFSSNEKSGTTATSNATATGLPDGTYYWKVRTLDNSGNYSAWSSGSNFTVDVTAPSVPASLTKTVIGNNVALDWTDSTDVLSGAKQYQVQLDKNADFSSPDYTASPTASAASFNGLTDGTFYWRVRTQDNAGNYSGWSVGSSFVSDIAGNNAGALLLSTPSTTGSVGLNDPADYYKLTMTGAGTLTLGLTGLSGDANLSLLDSKGKLLKTSANRGTANESIANLLLTSGTYYVNIAPVRGVNSASYTLTHAETYFPDDKAANTWQTAKDIATLDNWVGYGDPADCYKLTMTNAGTLTLGLTGLSGDSNLSLLDSKGTVLKTSANRLNAAEAITANLLMGTYYVKVAPVTGVNSATYTLTHAEKYCPDDKAKNTWQTAKDIATLDNWVGFGDPADCYKLAMSKNGTLALNLTGLTSDVNLSLLDSKGKVLKTSANKLNASEAITADLAVGTYYVNVAPVTGVSSANYTLTHTENYFPNDTAPNTFALARQVTTSGAVNEWLGFGDKDDYYKFELKTSTTVAFNLTGINSDVNLYLYDGKNRQLAASAKTGNTAESISKQLGIGTYYVKATLAGKANTSYALNFNIDPAAFKSGSLQLFGASSPLTGSSDVLGNDPLKKNQGMLAS